MTLLPPGVHYWGLWIVTALTGTIKQGGEDARLTGL